MPALGMGTHRIPDLDLPEVVRAAAGHGYRMIDTATAYGNERGVGEGIRRAGLPREDFFVVSKLAGRDQGYDSALRGFEASLRRTGLDYLDLYLVHWPMPARGRYADTWRAFVRLLDEGRVRAIGVSNFLPEHIDRINDETGVLPAVNQIQIDPRVTQRPWRTYAARRRIVVQSWSPLGAGGPLLGDPVVRTVAARHGVTPAQAVLRWHLELGLVPIVKSADPARLAENAAVFSSGHFALDDADRATLAELDGTRTPMDPAVFEED
ncbi:aldo/keto reductase [Streptomyces sp. NPDC059918]|uniref:aldo/keto reductase n=1 Tax=unclassified Streptomyces TaxID=2593676 RepID=UPI00365FEE0F